MADKKFEINRRSFIKGAAVTTALGIGSKVMSAPLKYFKPMTIDNPLAQYPDREWESVYRNIFKPDSHFHFLCAPNDTHNCLLKTYMKNGVVLRIGPSFGYGKAQDLYGNRASHRWDPRICQKGLALGRRVYGDRRLKAPMIRRGYKEWIDAGFPRDKDTGKPDPKYFQRGRDKWLRASWDEIFKYTALAAENIAKTYSGEKGAEYLRLQGYEPEMIDSMGGSGLQTFKLRGGMAFLGATRLFGMYRMANSLALMDAKIRGVSSDEAKGARGWDSYSWHTDLPPGHPMVTGAQTNDFDLSCTEYANLIISWGMNWITTKMPDSHWMTEARIRGAKIAAVTVEYSATASKCDEVAIIRPGTDPAFALGLAQVLIQRNWYDREWVQKNTDLPFLIRMDTLQPLRPHEVIDGFVAKELKSISFKNKKEKVNNLSQTQQFAPDTMKDHFAPYLVMDEDKKISVVTRDDFGPGFEKLGITPDLNAQTTVRLLDGQEVRVRTVFDLTKEYLDQNFTPEKTSQITGCPVPGIYKLAQMISQNKEKTLFAVGMGPNQFFNADLKDRAIFLVAALTRNVGFPGGNVGSYAGNYRSAIIGGEPVYAMEDPFNLSLEEGQKPKTRKFLQYESLHFFNYGDRPLKVGKKMFTPKEHMPSPTKFMWNSNSNSTIGNTKWHYDVVMNTLPKVEFIAYADWWWTGSCEYADIVYAADSWAEVKVPDITGSCTNPFVQVYPETPLPRIFDTKADIEILAGVAKAIAEKIEEPRLKDVFHFVFAGKTEEYIQRIIDASASLKGYQFNDLRAKAKEGIPALMNMRTYPRISSYEQALGEEPWHTKSGRLEFYRFEKEFIEHGENLVVYREPVDSTHYEPNVIVAAPHDAIRPLKPEDWGFSTSDLSCETRQVRNVIMSTDEVLNSKHPLKLKLKFSHVYHTPKYRHGAHSTPIDTDFNAMFFGPFGDVYRRDSRQPFVTEGYVDINPDDAKAMGVEDGDYIYIDADPEDRPFRNWTEGTEEYKVSRLMLRARYYPGTPKGIARTWHNMYGATFGSVKGHETREDGLAKSPETNYQSLYRYGSHQSATRAWLRPTLQTETLVHKTMFGQGMDKGFEPDIHCTNGAPREAFVKMSKAEAGGIGGKGKFRPAELGYRPTYENKAMKAYLAGGFLKPGKE
ncbi:MAG: molybdopterin-dependent oxidoreductase [Candidatus Cloacimonetes bacterium]|nr:molybdopterin-dependent oxidoreductase [Candidatus Cloacimonadota bacterium]